MTLNRPRGAGVRIAYVGPGLSGCHASFKHVLHQCSGVEERPYTAGHCDYVRGTERLRLDLIICKQRPIASERGPAALDELARVDGIIFVVDSQDARLVHNEQHLQALSDDLKALGVDLDELPTVFSLNKQDLASMGPAQLVPVEILTARLRTGRCAHVPTSATLGRGIWESLDELLALIDRAPRRMA